MGKIIYIKEGKNLTIQIKDILTGRVIKGPLANAQVFFDVAGTRTLATTTDANGNYAIAARLQPAGDYKFVVVSTEDTVDTSTGKIYSGTLSAPSGASVVTPITTLVAETGLEAAGIAEKLGLSGDVLNFDTYADGVDTTTAAQFESKAIQINNIVTTLQAAAEASGITAAKASEITNAAIENIFASVEEGNVVDLTSTEVINNLQGNVQTSLADVDGANTAVFTNTMTKVTASLAATNNSVNLAATIEGASLESLVASATESSNLVTQVSFQAEAEQVAVETGVAAPDYVSVNRTALTDSNIKEIVNLWIENKENEVFTNSENSTYYGDIKTWDVSQVTDMSGLFKHKHSFNDDISKWNISSVTNMNAMFCNAHEFDQDISRWDVRNVTDMSYMFSNAKKFNKSLNDWKVGAVTDMSGMFLEATLFNQPLNKWDVKNVLDMSYMLYGSAFNQDISSWVYNDDVERFAFCSLDLSGCDLSACDLSGVDLSGCDLSGVDLSGVDVEKCKCD